MKVQYDEGPCDIYIKSVAANMIKRNILLQIMSIGLCDLTGKVFASILNLTNEKNKKIIFFTDPIFASINCNLILLLGKRTYFDNIIKRFSCVDKIV